LTAIKSTARLYTHKEGIRNGFSELYSKKGDLMQKGNFKDGKADGQWIIWLNDIQYNRTPIYVKATYKEGKRFGTSIYYTKDNNVIAKSIYDNGKLIEGDYEDDDNLFMWYDVDYWKSDEMDHEDEENLKKWIEESPILSLSLSIHPFLVESIAFE
jgi:hypothetical protein